MSDHEDLCAIMLGYNWCTCILHAEKQVARGLALYFGRSGQANCGGPGHEAWRLQHRPCRACEAVV